MGVGGQPHGRPLYPRERPGAHCIGGWVRSHGRSGQVRKISSPTCIRSRTVQPVASHCTDCAIPAHVAYPRSLEFLAGLMELWLRTFCSSAVALRWLFAQKVLVLPSSYTTGTLVTVHCLDHVCCIMCDAADGDSPCIVRQVWTIFLKNPGAMSKF